MAASYEESSVWISSSESEASDTEDSTLIAVTPYSRIKAVNRTSQIARKSLLPGNRPPHNPKRELAVHTFLKEKHDEFSEGSRHVIQFLSCAIYQNGRITMDFPLMQTDLKDVFYKRKEEIAKSPELRGLMLERLLEIAGALEWIHELGIIHRDVNPSNILLSNDLNEPAYLADFGIAWMDGYHDDPDEGIVKYCSGVGTGPYRAPELIFSPKDYGCQVDIWSFGCTVAELFTPKPTMFSDGAEDGGLSSDLVLLGSIVSILGTPTSETWPEKAKTFRDWDKIQLNMKPAMPRKDVVPWAAEEILPWIFSMIAISAGARPTGKAIVEQGRKLLV